MFAASVDEDQIIARVAALDIGKAELVTGVAERVPERLAQLVYLDAACPLTARTITTPGGLPTKSAPLTVPRQKPPDTPASLAYQPGTSRT